MRTLIYFQVTKGFWVQIKYDGPCPLTADVVRNTDKVFLEADGVGKESTGLAWGPALYYLGFG